jgi:RNA polymerase sigma-70 factor (ECF subfamily)
MSTDPAGDIDNEGLLRAAGQGDSGAIQILLDQHRERLRRMVALRLDRRLSARLDPSDIVQEALADATRKLDGYVRDRPLPFYPWLHRLASERIIQAHRRHLPKVGREESFARAQVDGSTLLLAERLIAGDTTPAAHLIGEEQRRRLIEALAELDAADREVLVLRYLEDLTFPEIAAILEVGESAAKMRHLRALQRIRHLMGPEAPDSSG